MEGQLPRIRDSLNIYFERYMLLIEEALVKQGLPHTDLFMLIAGILETGTIPDEAGLALC